MSPNSDEVAVAWEKHRCCFSIYAILSELVIVILFGAFVTYNAAGKGDAIALADEAITTYYPLFQDVNVMIFVGFGFLMTFLAKYGFSSVGYNFVLAAFSIQVSILFSGFWERVYKEASESGSGFDHPLEVGVITLTKALFAAGAVLISMGACLGKTTPTQLLVMATFELFFFAINETIVVSYFGAIDMGGSMVVHAFGAYFGLAASRMISSAKTAGADGEPAKVETHPREKSRKSSDMFAMVGTLFLWMFWPSFNGALAPDDQQQRVVVNTFLALSACCVAAFFADALMRPGRKFDMVSIQNATLAGGVAVGSSADLALQPYGALLVGTIAGIISVVGYVYVSPGLESFMGLHDTCGVHNLHGMPGVMAGFVNAIVTAVTSVATGSYVSTAQIEGIYPARAPCVVNQTSPCGRTAGQQAGFQAASVVVTLCIAIVGGIITGIFMQSPCLLPPGQPRDTCFKCGRGLDRKYWFEDKYYWHVPSDDEEEEEKTHLPTDASELEMVNVEGTADDQTSTTNNTD